MTHARALTHDDTHLFCTPDQVSMNGASLTHWLSMAIGVRIPPLEDAVALSIALLAPGAIHKKNRAEFLRPAFVNGCGDR